MRLIWIARCKTAWPICMIQIDGRTKDVLWWRHRGAWSAKAVVVRDAGELRRHFSWFQNANKSGLGRHQHRMFPLVNHAVSKLTVGVEHIRVAYD